MPESLVLALTVLGIFLCLVQSAIFSGLTLGFFGLSRLKLEIQAEAGIHNARRILDLRKDANFLLATLLWGNVAVNVLMTLLTDSVMTGVMAFVFSTFGITILGEILPQSYMARHALRAGAVLIPLVQFFQVLLYVVAKPTAMVLDLWLGKEGITYFKEEEVKILIKKHVQSGRTDLGPIEGLGAVNFLALDDILIQHEGEIINPESIIQMDEVDGKLKFPQISNDPTDSFLQRVNKSKEKWVILTNREGEPKLVLDSDQFLRDAVYGPGITNPYNFCHIPVLVKEPGMKLGDVLHKLKVTPEHLEDDVIDKDLILYWNGERRIITGADILGRLFRGIAGRQNP